MSEPQTESDQRGVPAPLPPAPLGWVQRWNGRLRGSYAPRAQRLRCHLVSLRRDVEAFQDQHQDASVRPAWLAKAEGLLADAERAFRGSLFDEAWHCAHCTRRALLYGLDNAALNAQAEALEQEAEAEGKFRPWRANTIKALAARAASAEDQHEKAVLLEQAMDIRDTHSEGVYYNYAVTRNSLTQLSALLLALLAWGLWQLSTDGVLPGVSDGAVNSLASVNIDLVAVAVLGALGATLSAIESLSRTEDGGRIPDRAQATLITFSRPFIGAVSAVVVILALRSGVIAVPEMEDVAALIWIVAFASGFSERLFMRAMQNTLPSGKAQT